MRTAMYGQTKQVLKARVARYHFASIKVLVNFFQDDTAVLTACFIGNIKW